MSALGVVLARRPIYAAIALLVHSLSLAALFALLSAAMVAVGQVIIYSGAIVVLFLFVVTLLPAGRPRARPDRQPRRRRRASPAAACWSPWPPPWPAALCRQRQPAVDLSVAAVGHALFGPLLVAFELTAPLLLVAIVGAVVIWRRHEPRPRTRRAPSKIASRAAWSCTDDAPRSLVLATSAGLFAIGAAGVLLHRHPVAHADGRRSDAERGQSADRARPRACAAWSTPRRRR